VFQTHVDGSRVDDSVLHWGSKMVTTFDSKLTRVQCRTSRPV
jgi:hypothetical protein